MKSKQYTIRGISPDLDDRLREEMRRTGKSLNSIAVETLDQTFRSGGEPLLRDDMEDLIGTWEKDPDCENALESMRVIEPHLWK